MLEKVSNMMSMDNASGAYASQRLGRGLTELIMLAKAGNREALAEICARFEPLILKLARTVHGERLEDPRQDLLIELMDAVARFKPVPAGDRGE